MGERACERAATYSLVYCTLATIEVASIQYRTKRCAPSSHSRRPANPPTHEGLEVSHHSARQIRKFRAQAARNPHADIEVCACPDQ